MYYCKTGFARAGFRTTKMAAVVDSEMSPITNVYGKPFTKILCLLPSSLGVKVDDFRRTRLPPEHWIDTRKFLTRRRELATGIFELFGNFSDESAYTVRNNMIQWVQDNRGNFEVWTSIIRKHKKLTLAEWIKWMVDEDTPGDEIALFALARMYNRHVIVYTKKYHWTTVVHHVDVPEEEVAGWCDIHLLFIKPYVFGEIKRIRKPVAPPALTTPISKPTESSSVITAKGAETDDVITDKDVITGSESRNVVIPENTGTVPSRPSRKRSRTVVKLPVPPKMRTKNTQSLTSTGSIGMRTRSSVRTAATSKVLSSGRRVKKVNYADETEPKKKPKRSYRATREPSSARLAAHQRIVQERELQKEVTKGTENKELTTDIPDENKEMDNPDDVQEKPEEVAVLLALGEQLPTEADDLLEENANLMPIGGAAQTAQVNLEGETPPDQPETSAPDQPTDQTTDKAPPAPVEGETLPDSSGGGAKPKTTQTKGTFTMKRHGLPKPTPDPRLFHCPFEGCERSTNTAGELNAHYRRRHPPVKCPICGREFDTPSSLNKHKYTHNTPKHVCDHCGECFHFKSQYDSHVRKHLKNPSFQCMSNGCGKWFKRKGELNAHLVVHSGEIFKCEEEGCDYTTNDPRNLRAHLRSHSDELPFKCIFCGEGHRYEEQKKRHINKCSLNPKNVKQDAS